jgi:hypothetical protein
MFHNHARRGISAVLAGVAVIAAGVLSGGVATASNDSGKATAADADAQSNTVEDFNYPGADDIFASRGIRLKRGDGHIVLADCGASGAIQVKSRVTNGDTCFRAIGTRGYLTLEIPSVFLIYGGDHHTTATLTPAGGASKTYDVPAGLWKPVGESDTGTAAALMEIRIA